MCPGAERLYIACLLAQLKGIQSLFQRAFRLYTGNGAALGRHHFGCLGVAAFFQPRPALHRGVQVGVRAVGQNGVVVHQGARVHKAGAAQHGRRVHYGPLQHQAALAQLCRGADNCRGVHNAGHAVARGQQLFGPGQAQAVFPKGSHGLGVFAGELGVIHAFSHHGLAAHGVIQKTHTAPFSGGQRHLAYHTAQPAAAHN